MRNLVLPIFDAAKGVACRFLANRFNQDQGPVRASGYHKFDFIDTMNGGFRTSIYLQGDLVLTEWVYVDPYKPVTRGGIILWKENPPVLCAMEENRPISVERVCLYASKPNIDESVGAEIPTLLSPDFYFKAANRIKSASMNAGSTNRGKITERWGHEHIDAFYTTISKDRKIVAGPERAQFGYDPGQRAYLIIPH